MQEPGYARHKVTEWKWWLVATEGRDYEKYLATAVADGCSWDRAQRGLCT